MWIKRYIILFALLIPIYANSQNKIIDISAKEGTTGTLVKITADEDWEYYPMVYFGSASAYTITVKGPVINAIVGSGATGPITLMNPNNQTTLSKENFTFTYYPKIYVTDVLIEPSNTDISKKTLYLLGTGISQVKSIIAGEQTINLGTNLNIISDSKAILTIPSNLKLKTLIVNNPVESVVVQYIQ